MDGRKIKPSLKKQLTRLDVLIKDFKYLNELYHGAYEKTLCRLENERTELVAQIGRRP